MRYHITDITCNYMGFTNVYANCKGQFCMSRLHFTVKDGVRVFLSFLSSSFAKGTLKLHEISASVISCKVNLKSS